MQIIEDVEKIFTREDAQLKKVGALLKEYADEAMQRVEQAAGPALNAEDAALKVFVAEMQTLAAKFLAAAL